MNMEQNTLAIVCVTDWMPDLAPDQARSVWYTGLEQGLSRDFADTLSAYREAALSVCALVNEGAQTGDGTPHPEQSALTQLAGLNRAKDFRRRHYEQLPGKSALPEFFMDSAAMLGLSRLAWRSRMPELVRYACGEAEWAEAAHSRIAQAINAELAAGKRVLVVSHGLGSVVAWHAGLAVSGSVDWLTLGSPLGCNWLRRRLGLLDTPLPGCIRAWHNVAAEDDWVCHDKMLRDDYFKPLAQAGLTVLEDHTIYSLAVMQGRSCPHSLAGYLVHPRVSGLLAQWLSAGFQNVPLEGAVGVDQSEELG